MSFDALLSFVCTGHGDGKNTPPVKMSISPTPASVADLKLAIQEKFQIPKCLQFISMNSGQTPLADLQLIKDLYIRSEDSFTVTYLDRANVKTIGYFATECLRPLVAKLNTISLENKHDVGSFVEANTRKLSNLCHMYNTVTYDNFLMPWSGLTTVEANRQFLVQEKAIDNTIKLLSTLLDVPMESKHEMFDDLVESCLGLLWNFAETRQSRLHVVKRGGYQLMLRTLELCSRSETDGKRPYDMYGLFDRSVGCVSNYSEISQCQIPLASNKRVMNSLLDFCLEGPSLNVITKLLIANCLFRLSHNINTHKYLLEADILGKVLLFFSKFKDNLTYRTSMVVCYALAVTLSRLLSFSPSQVPHYLMVESLSSLKLFLASVKRENMTPALEEYQCNWITVAPFVDVFFSPIHNRTNEQESTPSQEVDLRALCMQTSLTALSVEMNRPCHRILALNQGLLDTLICLSWAVEVKWRHQVCVIVELFRKDNESLHLPVPKLHTLAAVCLARDNLFSIRDTFNFS